MLFPLQLTIRIDWSELDLFGHVNNVAYFKYIQAARVNYWEQIGLMQLYHEKNRGPIVASTGCQFKKPLFYPGAVTIQTRIEFIKTTSFGIHHQLLDSENTLVAEAHDIAVMFDFKSHSKMIFPNDIKQRIEELEKKAF